MPQWVKTVPTWYHSYIMSDQIISSCYFKISSWNHILIPCHVRHPGDSIMLWWYYDIISLSLDMISHWYIRYIILIWYNVLDVMGTMAFFVNENSWLDSFQITDIHKSYTIYMINIIWNCTCLSMQWNISSSSKVYTRADSRLAPSQWETSLQSDTVSHWLGANLESALHTMRSTKYQYWKVTLVMLCMNIECIP